MFLSAMLDLHHGWTELTWTSERRGTGPGGVPPVGFRVSNTKAIHSKITMFPKEFESSIKADH